MKKYWYSLISLCCIVFIMACSDHKAEPKTFTHQVEVKPRPLHKSLHFTGIVQPLSENTVVSPIEAVVESMHFHYGQLVKENEIVLTLNSMDLQKQYNETLTDYLKAKDSYSIAKAKFSGTQDLWKAGLLSKNNYLSEKSSMDTARMTLMQARRKWSELLEKMDIRDSSGLSTLSLSDFDKVRKILTAKHNIIHLKAPSAGVMLYPPKSSDDKSAKITVGAIVKPGQVIALVGNLKGISIEIDVPEVDIDKISPGMSATISGVAFGRHQLKGSLVSVNAQASNSSSGGLPSFTAIVEVKALTPEEQRWIKVGMSAAIEINIDSKNQLMIPIRAITQEKGNSVVHLLARGKIEKRIITTGAAQADSVIVESGLKIGEVVVYD